MGNKPVKIGVWHNGTTRMCGCFKVINNLVCGLKEGGYKVLENGIGDLNGCLQKHPMVNVPKNTLIGPEIMVLPSEHEELWSKFKYWTQPSQWVVDYYKQFSVTKKNEFFVWPVGIETDKFVPRKSVAFDCLVYYKNVTKQTPRHKLKQAEKVLRKYKQKFKIVEYGKYDQEVFIKLLNQCRYCIWMCGSESQNIAIMEAWSTNVPTYIVNEFHFRHKDFIFRYGASSAPYFDPSCGYYAKGFLDFTKFLKKVDIYQPREYMLSKFTLKKCAEHYVELLKNAYEV